MLDYRLLGTNSWSPLAVLPRNSMSYMADFSNKPGGNYELVVLPDNVDSGGWKISQDS